MALDAIERAVNYYESKISGGWDGAARAELAKVRELIEAAREFRTLGDDTSKFLLYEAIAALEGK